MFSTTSAFASIQVAFIKLYNSRGELIRLEKDSPYAHVAISYGRMWLHAHPFRGVELLSDQEMRQWGEISEVIVVSATRSLSYVEIQKYLGRPYDRTYSWNEGAYYCSELVAKILGIKPRPMSFDRQYWPPFFEKYNGQLGVSPRQLLMTFRPRSCQHLF